MKKKRHVKEFPRFSEKPKIYDDRVEAFRTFKEDVYSPASVLYPCCDWDASPSEVFDNVTYVDINKEAVGALKKVGLEAQAKDISKYTPAEVHDLLILMNAPAAAEESLKHLKKDGYIIANDYLGSASRVYRDPGFSLWGTIKTIGKEKSHFKEIPTTIQGLFSYIAEVSRDLSGLFEPVKNGEELKKLRPNYYEYLLSQFKMFELNMEDFSAEGPFDEVYKRYSEVLGVKDMPYKREASFYIFQKL